MYDPTIGKWISEDPQGFDAGDANLYRYVDNQPTTNIDPAGMAQIGVQPDSFLPEYSVPLRPLPSREEQRRDDVRNLYLPISDYYRAPTFFRGSADLGKRRIVRQALVQAADRIWYAWDALENRWPQVQARLRNEPDLDILFGQGRPTEANRDFYRTNLRLVIDRLREERSLPICINDEARGDAVAYVYRFGDTIYINPVFFDAAHPRDITLVHELGRLVPRITGNSVVNGGSPASTNTITNWDNLVWCLSDNYNRLR